MTTPTNRLRRKREEWLCMRAKQQRENRHGTRHTSVEDKKDNKQPKETEADHLNDKCK